MSIFAIADLHLGFSVDKPMDIFAGWKDHYKKIEENWRQKVKDGDFVIIPGDVSWGLTLEESLEDFRFIHALPGKKILLKGNHDYWWTTRKKMEAFFEQNGLNSIQILHNNAVACENIAVCGSRGWIFEGGDPLDEKIIKREAQRLETSVQMAIQTGLEPVAFLHYPPIYGQQTCPEILDVLVRYPIKRCYYGHIHGAGMAYAFNGNWCGIDFRLISADFLKFDLIQVL